MRIPKTIAILLSVIIIISIAVAVLLVFSSKPDSEEILTEHARLADELSDMRIMLERAQKQLKALSTQADETAELKEKLEEVTARLTAAENNLQETLDLYHHNERMVFKALHLLQSLPQISKRMAFIHEASAEGDTLRISLDYVEWLTGDEARRAAEEDDKVDEAALENGYYVRNMEVDNDRYAFDIGDVILLTLDGASSSFADYRIILDDPDVLEGRLFHVYAVDRQLLVLEEQYRP